MSFAVIDVIFIIVMLMCAVHGAARGFLDELFSKLAVIAGLVFGFVMNKALVPHLPQIAFLTQILAFLIIFVVVYVAVRVAQKIIGFAFQGDIMRGLDKSLGFFLGIGEGVLIVVLVLFLLHAQPFFAVGGILSGSYFDIMFSPLFTTAPALPKGVV